MSRRKFGHSLSRGLDNDVYQVVRRLEERQQQQHEDESQPQEQTQQPPHQQPRLGVAAVYGDIVRSNSSLARQKKRVLEESIERVLALRRRERQADEEDEDADSDAMLEAAAEASRSASGKEDRDAFVLNRQLARHWNFSQNGSGGSKAAAAAAAAAAADGATTATPPAGGSGDGAAERQPDGQPRPKRRRAEGGGTRSRAVDRSPPEGISLRDLAGVDAVLDKLLDCVWQPLIRRERFAAAAYRSKNSVLLHGPSGCGKTALANAVAASVGVSFIPILASSLVGGTSGESEKNIRDLFEEAIRLAPCLLFIDEVDSIFGRRDLAQKGMEGRMVAEMVSGMDKIAQRSTDGRNIVVLAATNRPESLDPIVRRRFYVEIEMPMPSQKARELILRAQTRNMLLADDIDFEELAKLTPGYVGADLDHVVNAAFVGTLRGELDHILQHTDSNGIDAPAEDSLVLRNWLSLERGYSEPAEYSPITFADFKAAIAKVQPASKREGFSAIPDTTWGDVGALHDVRKRLEMTIIGPISNPALFARVGIQPAAGIMLWGPPGCGKTLVAKAVANESKANFISIGGPELLNKYVGESERAVRQLFSRAKSSAPCILFFDEMDALVPRRDDSLSDASARVVNTLLTELDGVGDRSGVYVVGATNRPDIIDPAIRRPGRLGTAIFVGLPSEDDRVDILQTIYRNTIRAGRGSGGSDKNPDATGANNNRHAGAAAGPTTTPDRKSPQQPLPAEIAAHLEAVARDPRCAGFSGADLSNLMQAAAQACLERAFVTMDAEPVIAAQDWESALTEVKPSVTDLGMYGGLGG